MRICKWRFKKCPQQNTIFLNPVLMLFYQKKEQLTYVCAHWRADLITYVTVETAAVASMCDEKLHKILEILKAMSVKKDGWDETSAKVMQKQWGHGSKRNSISVGLLARSYFAGVRLSAVHRYKNISPTAETGRWLEEWVSRLRR